MKGDGTNIQIQQIGSNDRIYFGINVSSQPRPQISSPYCFACPPNTVGNTFFYQVMGNNAIADIDSNSNGKNTSVSNTVSIVEIGDSNRDIVNIIGSFNTTYLTTTGNNNQFTNIISDRGNTQTTNTQGAKNVIQVTQSGTTGVVINNIQGALNTIIVAQEDGGSNGHASAVDISGNLNTVNVKQSGLSGDSVVNVNTRGNSNNITITSSTR
jgi:hypothetical protein